MFPNTIQKELKRSRLLARALAFALVRFREHYDMLSNPLSICKSGWQSKMIPNPWVIRDDSGWSLVVPNDVLDWNSPCSTSHLCNDLIYTLVDSTGWEIQVQWDGNGRDVQGLSMSLTKTLMYQSIKFVGIVHFTGSQTNFPGLVAVTPWRIWYLSTLPKFSCAKGWKPVAKQSCKVQVGFKLPSTST